MVAAHEIWAYELRNVDGTPRVHHCPRCGEAATFGGNRSLWSLIPFVCVHQVQDWTPRVVGHGASTAGLVRVVVERSYPVGTPGQRLGPLGLICDMLSARLTQEYKGLRLAWWLPMWTTSKGREVLHDRRVRRRTLANRPTTT